MEFSKFIAVGFGLSFLAFNNASAQDCCPTDTIYKHCNLQEVLITEKVSGDNALLKFYKSTKTSSTEDVLSRLAAVNLIRRGNYAMEPVVRGFSASQTGLTLDGIKIFGACTDHMDPPTSYVEPSNLKSIQLATSAGASKFGSTIGGSLNLQLAQAQLATEKPFTGMFTTAYSLASQSSNNVLELNYGGKKFGVRFSGVYRKAGNYLANHQEVPFTQYQKLNFSVNSKYMLTQNSFVSLDVLADDGWDIGYAALPMDVSSAKARIYALSYKTYPKNKAFNYFEAKAYGNNIIHSMDDTKRPLTPIHMDMPGWSNTYGAYAETAITLNPKNLLTVRTDGYTNFTRAEMTMYPQNSSPMFMLTWPDVRNTTIGLYLNNDYQLNQKLTLNLNGRLDYSTSKVTSEIGRTQLEVFNYEVDNARVRLLKNINGGTTYKSGNFHSSINIGYSERPSSTNELYGFYLFNAYDGYDYIGNPNLKDEESLNVELNAGYKTNFADLTVALFNNQIQNYTLGKYRSELSVMTIGANGVKVYEQIAHASLRGFEIGLSTVLLKNLQLISNARYTEGTDDNNNPLPLISPFKLTSSIRFAKANFSIQAENIWASAQNKVSTMINEKTTPAYTLFNLRGTYAFKVKQHKLELNAGVENLFDAYYQDHLDWGNIPRPGRNVMMGLSYVF